MNILIACEFSGRVREAFRRRGHNAWSCDLEPAEDNSKFHHTGDVLTFLKKHPKWDMMIAHPPCTYLANSGARWLYKNGSHQKDPQRWKLMRKAVDFFLALLNQTDIPRIAIENPIIHKHAKEKIGQQTQVIQPWMFGHGETKATCLWLKNLPQLQATNIVEGRTPRVHHAAPGPNRWKERSRTLQGIADAMADQWGESQNTDSTKD